MQSISLFFGKYQNLGLEQKIVKRSICESLKEVCGVEIETKDIKIIRDEIKINVIGSAKSQILIKKNILNKTFQEKISKLGIVKNKIIS